ncbi:DnaJ domain containing protein [Theileria equi strain WA]|uniref:DnaJ domain containing protein n=1 Tax=Theileria equi strain WA TaxID=1537102 RepID=L0AW61_THEEQ|nr:DnaJ domain containing protein [Theileria equi strain WA]AFZ79139.1 DnaJ domain containing protein [Theileria equi strain WA]|eukprot:XP_004828805.1 DnaJ domain containing protein [Theileria equi strain WA]
MMSRICLMLKRNLPLNFLLLNFLVVLSHGIFINHRNLPLNSISYIEYNIAFVSPSRNTLSFDKHQDSKSDSFHVHPEFKGRLDQNTRFNALNSRTSENSEGFVDYYKILSLDKNCTLNDIEERYRSIKKSLNSLPSIDSKLKNAIDTAYNVLSNNESRLKYDNTYGNHNFTHFHGAEAIINDDHNNSSEILESDDEVEISIIDDEDDSPENNTGFGGFFSNLFGLNKKKSTKGQKRKIKNLANGKLDISCTANIDLKTLVFGGTIELSVDKFTDCDACNASDHSTKTYIDTCTECKGRGMITKGKKTQFGFISTSRTCHTCSGSGVYRSRDCLECGNRGSTFKTTTIKVHVPKESKPDQIIRLRGKGHSGGFSTNSGDLFVKLCIKSGNNEYMEGDSIVTNHKISYLKAILGYETKVPTFNGDVTVKIPKGSQPGDKIFVGTYNSMKHFVKLLVHLPAEPSQKELELLKQLDNL